MSEKIVVNIYRGAVGVVLGAIGLGGLIALLPLLAIMGFLVYFFLAAIYWMIGWVGMTIVSLILLIAFGPSLASGFRS